MLVLDLPEKYITENTGTGRMQHVKNILKLINIETYSVLFWQEL